MAVQSRASFIFLLACIICTTSTTFASSKCDPKNTLIQKECSATHFQQLCCKTLIPYASTIKNDRRAICKAGILASISATEATLTLLDNMSMNRRVMSNVTVADAVSWCKIDFGRSVHKIKEALVQYNANFKSDVGIFRDAVVTYIVGALSDEDFCLQRPDQGGVLKESHKDVYAAVLRAVKLKRITQTIINRL